MGVSDAVPATPIVVPPHFADIVFASPSLPDNFGLMVGLYPAGCSGAAGFSFWMAARLAGAVSWVFGGLLLGVMGMSV